jgi:hypothetical protein
MIEQQQQQLSGLKDNFVFWFFLLTDQYLIKFDLNNCNRMEKGSIYSF